MSDPCPPVLDVRREHVCCQIRLFSDEVLCVFYTSSYLKGDDLLHRYELSLPEVGEYFWVRMRPRLLYGLQLFPARILDRVCLRGNQLSTDNYSVGRHTAAFNRSPSFLIHLAPNALPLPTLALSVPTIPCIIRSVML